MPASHAHERTSLLVEQGGSRKRHPLGRTPLPKLQVFVVLMVGLMEPISAQCIYPFINKLVSELDITGGDEKKVGYYAGLIESLFFVTEACTTLQWGRLSDTMGRKPVLLIGLAGVAMSLISFGLSKTFTSLVVSRCLAGMLNGNVGVVKSVMAELTDETNMAQGFALLSITYSMGVTIGPFLGGQLARPHERFPHLFNSRFWITYPYFLPCATAALISITSFLLTFFFLKETLPHYASDSDSETDESSQNSHASSDTLAPLPFRAILIPPVIIAILNYSLLALTEGSFIAVLPLFYNTRVEVGGLGLSVPTIGLALAGMGLWNGLFQVLFFSDFHARYGAKRVFLAGMVAFIPTFALFPVLNVMARKSGMTPVTWGIALLQLAVNPFVEFAYGCSYMFVSASAPSKRSLGATNGLAQTTASVFRAIAPAASTSLFAISIDRGLLGGWLVYVVLVFISFIALSAATLLPGDI